MSVRIFHDSRLECEWPVNPAALSMACEPYGLVHGPSTLRPCPWPVDPTALSMARPPYGLVHGPSTLRPCPWPVNPTALSMARQPYGLVHGPSTLRPCPWPVNPTALSDYSCYSASRRVRFTGRFTSSFQIYFTRLKLK